MKKITLLLIAFATILAGCTNSSTTNRLTSENDSLRNVIAERDAALEEVVNTINAVEEGFDAINEAYGRVNLDAASAEQSKMAKLKKDISFINETLDSNRKRIAELEEQLKNNKNASAQLKKMVANLKAELEEKNKQIAQLQEELASKNIHIEELDKAVEGLKGNVNELSKVKADNEKTISAQDAQINTVWYAMGTKSELKEMKILSGKKVLKEAGAKMDYFTKADKRDLKTILTNEKSAKILTTHPEGSYKLERNKEKKYVLTITDADSFWSVSKYLVIQVR